MKKNAYLLSSVNNALKVLDILSVKSDIGVSEIARNVNIDKTSAYKILFTLEHRDYVLKTPNAKYRLGKKFNDYRNVVESRQSLAEIAQPFMENIVARCNETVCLATLNTNGKIIISNLVEGTSKNHIVSHIGFEMDSYDNANGKLLLANLDDTIKESIISYIKFQKRTPYTLSSKEALIEELNQIKNNSYVEQYEQFLLNHCDIAAPIYDSNNHVIAALSIATTPETLIKHHDIIVHNLCMNAQYISQRLSFNQKNR